MPKCGARNCSSTKKLFRLPRELIRRKMWLKQLNRKDLPADIPNTRDIRICSLHFEPEQFETIPLKKDGTIKLRPFAVPTLFGQKSRNNERVLRVTDTNDEPINGENGNIPLAQASRDHVYFQLPSNFPEIEENDSDTLCTNITELEEDKGSEKLKILSELAKANRKIKELEQKLSQQIEHLTHFLNEDQIIFLQSNNMRGFTWSNETIQKALQIRHACGSSGYATIKELCQPLPSERTLRRHLEGKKSMPEYELTVEKGRTRDCSTQKAADDKRTIKRAVEETRHRKGQDDSDE